jgi:hypothetical protein
MASSSQAQLQPAGSAAALSASGAPQPFSQLNPISDGSAGPSDHGWQAAAGSAGAHARSGSAGSAAGRGEGTSPGARGKAPISSFAVVTPLVPILGELCVALNQSVHARIRANSRSHARTCTCTGNKVPFNFSFTTPSILIMVNPQSAAAR